MIQNCFGTKTFLYENEENSSLPKVHIVHLDSSDTYFRENLVDHTQIAARNKGMLVGIEKGQIWILFNEAHIQRPDGSIDGGIAVGGYPHDSSDDPGFTLVGSNAIPWFRRILDDRIYEGHIIPELGPYPSYLTKVHRGLKDALLVRFLRQ